MWLAVCSVCQCYRECASADIAEASAQIHLLNFATDATVHRVHVVEIPADSRDRKTA